MSELFIIGMVRVLGGEPFLHPQLHSCVDIVLKYFAHSQIVVFTNGLLVDKIRQFHELYPTIQIHQSVYPPVERIFDQKSTSRLFVNQGINLNGDSDIVVARSSCSCKHSYSLWNGILYTCPVMRNFKKFEDAFNINLNIPPEHCSIDIHCHNAEEVLFALNSEELGLQGCKYCGAGGRRKMPWSTTKKDITEWI